MRLTATERGWLRVAFEAILPDDPAVEVPAGAREEALDGMLADLSRQAPAEVVLALRGAAFAAWWVAPLLATGRPRPLGSLPPERRAGAIDALSRSDRYVLREMPMLLKTFAALAYGADARTRPLLGRDDGGAS